MGVLISTMWGLTSQIRARWVGLFCFALLDSCFSASPDAKSYVLLGKGGDGEKAEGGRGRDKSFHPEDVNSNTEVDSPGRMSPVLLFPLQCTVSILNLSPFLWMIVCKVRRL